VVRCHKEGLRKAQNRTERPLNVYGEITLMICLSISHASRISLKKTGLKYSLWYSGGCEETHSRVETHPYEQER
jgi:hypothetical protein